LRVGFTHANCVGRVLASKGSCFSFFAPCSATFARSPMHEKRYISARICVLAAHAWGAECSVVSRRRKKSRVCLPRRCERTNNTTFTTCRSRRVVSGSPSRPRGMEISRPSVCCWARVHRPPRAFLIQVSCKSLQALAAKPPPLSSRAARRCSPKTLSPPTASATQRCAACIVVFACESHVCGRFFFFFFGWNRPRTVGNIVFQAITVPLSYTEKYSVLPLLGFFMCVCV
jgi:hypothetical protein